MAFRGNVTELATIADRSNHSFQSRVAKNSILEFPVFRFIGGPFLVRNFGPIFFLSRLLNGTPVVFLSKHRVPFPPNDIEIFIPFTAEENRLR